LGRGFAARSVGRSLRLAWLLGATLALAELPVATTKDVAHLREQPSGTATETATLPPGTKLQVLGELQGWKQVQTLDGKTGFVWAEHLMGAPTPPRAPEAPAPPTPAPDLRDELRTLREDVDALRARPEGAPAADLERLRTVVERLSNTARDLTRRLDERETPTPPDPQGEPLGFPWLVLLIGVFAGWGVSRLAARRRERRQRGKLWW
jgi:hypothetical protein